MAADSIDDAILSALEGLDTSSTDSAPEEPEAPAAEETDEDEQTDEADDDTEDEADEDETDATDEDAEDEDSEDDSEDDDEDVDEEEDGELELDEDTVLVMPDGTELTARELTDGYLRQADYTRKTQELAEERKEVQELQTKMVSWFDDRSKNPSAWIAEIANVYAEDSGKAIAGALAAAEKPDVALAGVLRHMVESGKLSDALVEQLGLKQIAEEAKAGAAEQRVERLERELQEERRREAAQRQQQELLRQYQAQWQSLVTSEAMQFDSPEAERTELMELMRFAREQQITNLATAYAARSYMESRKPAPTTEEPKPARKKAKEVVERKRKAGAIGRQSNAGGSSSRPGPTGDLDDAINRAFEAKGITSF